MSELKLTTVCIVFSRSPLREINVHRIYNSTATCHKHIPVYFEVDFRNVFDLVYITNRSRQRLTLKKYIIN